MKAARHGWPWWVAMVAFGIVPQIMGQSTNDAGQLLARPERPTQRFEESAFRIVPERNIFNANRSGGGQVRGPSRRPSSVEYFALVGTMDYEKGIFAFFEGSSSQFTKVLKPSEVIAGHKLLEISANGVKLEADGKRLDLPVGSQMRREDEGDWQMSESRGGISMASSAEGEASSRNNRWDRGDFRSRREDSSVRRSDTSASTGRPVTSAAPSTGNEDEVLKRLMERRERESK